jgi:hypothetical protein
MAAIPVVLAVLMGGPPLRGRFRARREAARALKVPAAVPAHER